MKESEKLLVALRRKAYGYTVSEQATEYDAEGNEVKNKVTTKDVPPDLAALKLLLEMEGNEEELSEEELVKERGRLLGMLSELNSAETKTKKRGKQNGNDKM